MKAKLIKIVNSKGLRLPKTIIEQCLLGNEIEMEINGNKLVLYSSQNTRKDWADAFKKMRANSDDKLLDDDIIESEWDNSEWTW